MWSVKAQYRTMTLDYIKTQTVIRQHSGRSLEDVMKLRVNLSSLNIYPSDLGTWDLHLFLMKFIDDNKMAGVTVTRKDGRNVDRKHFPLNMGGEEEAENAKHR